MYKLMTRFKIMTLKIKYNFVLAKLVINTHFYIKYGTFFSFNLMLKNVLA